MFEEMNQMSINSNDERWLELVTQCKSSGLSDRQWCIQNGIPVSTLSCPDPAKKMCEIPKTIYPVTQRQEVVQIPFWKTEPRVSDAASISIPSICLEM